MNELELAWKRLHGDGAERPVHDLSSFDLVAFVKRLERVVERLEYQSFLLESIYVERALSLPGSESPVEAGKDHWDDSSRLLVDKGKS
jgi:hypothetical protein